MAQARLAPLSCLPLLFVCYFKLTLLRNFFPSNPLALFAENALLFELFDLLIGVAQVLL